MLPIAHIAFIRIVSTKVQIIMNKVNLFKQNTVDKMWIFHLWVFPNQVQNGNYPALTQINRSIKFLNDQKHYKTPQFWQIQIIVQNIAVDAQVQKSLLQSRLVIIVKNVMQGKYTYRKQ